MALTPIGRRMIDNGIENLGAALALLEEMTGEGRSDEEIARRMEVFANAIALFTRCSTFTNISISAHGKFGLTWRQMLTIAREMYTKMAGWHAAGYLYVSFQAGNKSCWPSKQEAVQQRFKYGFIGSWSTLEWMVSVYCRGGVIDNPALTQEATAND